MQDVTKNRHLYIGGSDIPAIMGISPFKTRYDLLLEKSQLKDNDFKGNEYTEYGNVLEPYIRDYINLTMAAEFKPETKAIEDLRGNVDGFNGLCVLEIKTTSQIHSKVDDYKIYLVQLLFYMQMYEVEHGLLAVYRRPEDFNTNFDPAKLTVYPIDINDYKELLTEINAAVDAFRNDLQRLKQNPLLTEEELLNTDLTVIANKVVALEEKLQEYKDIEAEAKEMKANLLKAMQDYNVKKWTTNNGVQITRIDATEGGKEKVFDEKSFKEADPAMYERFLTEKTKRGRAAYVKITLPKK